ncbi:uncharacterized protein EAF01_009082 [Botrytis porri]|uniref:uncharacterized protein n=1 Tax=Botrytis porri TaxID=87229 RepID=UPI0018FF7CCC|nr:uncharacterized protein EAF01_009082 [Botrytis porri]KAF7896679.1 hypothetical protein EAF01_009082 [Botrytis porri]
MIWSISELKIEQHQEIALLRQETADLHKQLTSARIRIATLEERAIHRDARNDELQNTLNGRDGRDEKVKDLMDERNRGQLPRSEERYGYQIQARSYLGPISNCFVVKILDALD